MITLNLTPREKRDQGDLVLPLYYILYAEENPHQDRNVRIILYIFYIVFFILVFPNLII